MRGKVSKWSRRPGAGAVGGRSVPKGEHADATDCAGTWLSDVCVRACVSARGARARDGSKDADEARG
eukprot:6175754-Pleurochrysis_carterae.AAC.1